MILAVFKCAPFSTPQCARTTCAKALSRAACPEMCPRQEVDAMRDVDGSDSPI